MQSLTPYILLKKGITTFKVQYQKGVTTFLSQSIEGSQCGKANFDD